MTDEVQASAAGPAPAPRPYRAGFVALVGRPNVGKSTLLNAILGRKVAITTPKPQTTRNLIRGIYHLPEGQIILVDTPGIHRPRTKLGERMVRSAESEMKDADLLWHVVDLSRPPRPEDERVAALCRAVPVPAWLVGNKVDLVRDGPGAAAPYLALGSYPRHFLISAQSGLGLDALVAETLAALPEGYPYFPEDVVTDQPEDFYVAEVVREKVLLFLAQEIPHSVAVVVEERTRRSERLVYIRAAIVVERDSQKGIVIGEGGRMLRRIGEAARLELEAYYGHAVYLDLWVKVRKRWRDQEEWLRRFGFSEPKRE
ncbi:MAG: GTPase Era [Firmicutes bacterium]|nr:GTPase Era [Alicyclobacillaceae bacterium]MCL6496931.1 GTPase Era [Bacillota bacterium]